MSQLWQKLLGLTQLKRPDVMSTAPVEFLGPVAGIEYEVGQIPKRRRFTVYHSNTHGMLLDSEESDPLLQVRPDSTARACKALRRLGHQEWKSVEQAMAVALSMENVLDFVAILPTGSGKSLVFMAPSTMGPNM